MGQRHDICMEEGIRGRDIRQESRRRNSEERSGKDILNKEVVCWEEGSGGKDIIKESVRREEVSRTGDRSLGGGKW